MEGISRTAMLRTRVLDIMTRRDKHPFFSLATLLLGVSVVYGGMVRLRRHLYSRGILTTRELPCPVISVGNLALGGTGKTPMVIYLAELVLALGYRPAIISRGYRGLAEKSGTVVSDGHSLLCDARKAGDEPYLMATLLPTVPVVVGRDRYSAGLDTIRRFEPDVILLDDGFQHLRLKRDLNLLLLDAQNPFGNTYLFPRGTLREPVTCLNSADAVIVTRSPQRLAEHCPPSVHRNQRRPVFASNHQSMVRMVLGAQDPIRSLHRHDDTDTDLKGQLAFAFAGLGRNSAFFNALSHWPVRLLGTMDFDDHHLYSHGDLDRIGRAAVRAGATCLMTTDKDYVRLPQNARLPLDLIVMGVTLAFGKQQSKWRDYIGRELNGLIGR